MVEEREVKRKRMGIITREEWEVGRQVWIVIVTYRGDSNPDDSHPDDSHPDDSDPDDSHPDGVYVNAGQGDMTG